MLYPYLGSDIVIVHNGQRLSGSAFVTWTWFKTNDFKIIDKENYFKIYNSGTADRWFCLNCWSSFYFKYNDNSDLELWTDYVYFSKTNIITELDNFPSKHICYESHVKWIHLLDSLPKKEN